MIVPGLMTAVIAGAIAVPILLLFYFLKLRRKSLSISSTLLWKKAVEDLRVNAPFQKLRKNLLLFLQLLILFATLAALANPIASMVKALPRNVVVLIDRSGSMNAREADGRTRLDHAREAAVELVDHLPDAARAMVIGFADRAEVVCTFTGDRNRLVRLIREIEPTDARTQIGEALELAVAYSTRSVAESSATGTGAPSTDRAEIELFSDGRIEDAAKQAQVRGSLRYHRVGAVSDNVGIVAFDVRREIDRPGVVSVFVSVANFGPLAVKADVSLMVDGKTPSGGGAIREVSLGPLGQQPDSSVQSIVFELMQESGGVVEVRIHRDDALSIDNSAVAPIDPPRPVRMLVVTGRAPVQRIMMQLAQSLDIGEVIYKSPAEYESMDESELASEGRSAYDLVLFDAHDTQRLPPGNYIFLGGVPKVDGVVLEEEVAGGPILLAQQPHPVLRNVNYDSLYISKWRRIRLPAQATKLMEGEDATVMAMLSDAGHRYLITTFDLLDSNWPLKEAFPICMQNAIHYLAAGGVVESTRSIHPGDSITLNVPPSASEVEITMPDGGTEHVETVGREAVIFSRTTRCGLYTASFNDSSETLVRFGANCLDATESNARPDESLRIGAETIAGVIGTAKMNEPLWPYLAAAALAFVLVEWWVYNKRVMI